MKRVFSPFQPVPRAAIIRACLATVLACLAVPVARAQSTPAPDYRTMKYGFFVHYVWGGEAYSATVNKDGSKPAGLDDLAARFDAPKFAADLASMNVEYVVFTAWHANMNLLYPSKVMDKWLPGHTAKRDLIGDMIKACKAKGIQVLLYTHPRDGHDFMKQDQAKTGWADSGSSNPDWEKFDKQKWNDFINDVYGDLVDRYGKDILGLYLDEGSGAADSYKVVDYPRLRKTITAKHPHLVMMQNDYGNLYTGDIGNQEVFYNHSFGAMDGNQWASYKIPISIVVGSIFWAAFPEGKDAPAQTSAKVGFNKWVHYTPESMFRYTVLQAGANRDGGGVIWAAGPYPGGGWESGVLDRMQKTGALVDAVGKSIKNTYPSTSFVTTPGKKIAELGWGVATQSRDGKFEYLHVLKAPADGATSLQLPVPADGKKFAKARLLKDGTAVAMRQDANGLSLTLPAGAAWDALDTVIELDVAADSPMQNLALWKHFRASSHADNARHPSKANDGEEGTGWCSADGDKQAWGNVDLGGRCELSRIEVSGALEAGVSVQVAASQDFSTAKTVATLKKPADVLVVKKASYGKGEQTADVTAAARQAALAGRLSLVAGNALCGKDPAPNTPKELRVEYAMNGKDGVKVVAEGETLSIGSTAPWSVDLPVGTTGRFVRVLGKTGARALQINEIKVLGKSE